MAPLAWIDFQSEGAFLCPDDFGALRHRMNTKPIAHRLYSLDWLRVLAILAVFFFHSSRFFTEPPWHLSNAQFSEEAQILSIFVSTSSSVMSP